MCELLTQTAVHEYCDKKSKATLTSILASININLKNNITA